MPAKHASPTTPISSNEMLLDLSERSDGPSLIAVWGEDEPGSGFQLGTRETGWHSHRRGQLFYIENGLANQGLGCG